MVPLFGPIPGGPELLIIFLVLLLPIGVGLWVYRDAKRHGMAYAPAWALGVAALFFAWLIPGILGFVAYIYVREQNQTHERPV